MKEADIEAGKRNIAEYLADFYGSQRQKSSPRAATGADSEHYDPLAIGMAAKQRQAAVWKKGGQLSGTDAVTQILQEQRTTSQSR